MTDLDLPAQRMLLERASVRATSWRRVYLAHYIVTPTVEDLAAMAHAHAAFRKQVGRPTAILAYVERGMKMPEAPARRFAAELQRDMGADLLCSATVFGGEGFWASAAANVLIGIGLLLRPPSPTRYFTEVPLAAGWTVEFLSDPMARAPDLAAAVDRLRDSRPKDHPEG